MEHIQRLEGNVQLAQMRHDAIGSEVTAAVLKQAKEALEAAKAEAEKPAEEAAEPVKDPVTDPKKAEPQTEPKKETKAPAKKQTEPEKPAEDPATDLKKAEPEKTVGKGEASADQKAEGAGTDEKQPEKPAEDADCASAANAEEDAKKRDGVATNLALNEYEQLLVQADRLHQEAALLSNELHTFRDDDVAGVKPIIENILDLRKGWKAIRLRVEHFQKFGRFPEAQPKKISPEVSGSEAELRVELQRINVNIVKYTKKLADNPDHKKASAWEEELARMKAHKMDLQAQITRIKYETTQ